MITRSGSNAPHGSLYYFGRNDAVDARNFFSADVEPLKQHQYGATFGGPLRRNKLFSLASGKAFGTVRELPRQQRFQRLKSGRAISPGCRTPVQVTG
ncbi:MAG: hypothetical protein WKF37_15660 [Bryobacteraceae bacterium]